MQKQEPRARRGEEIVPITELDSVLKGNRATRRRFMANLRRRIKRARKEEKQQSKNA